MASLPGPARPTIRFLLDRVRAAFDDRHMPGPDALGRSICTGDIAGQSLIHAPERRDQDNPE